MKKIAGMILAGIGTALAAVSLLSQMSIGVIGGADGPVSVFAGGKTGSVLAVIGVIAGMALLSAGVFMIPKKIKSDLPQSPKKGK